MGAKQIGSAVSARSRNISDSRSFCEGEGIFDIDAYASGLDCFHAPITECMENIYHSPATKFLRLSQAELVPPASDDAPLNPLAILIRIERQGSPVTMAITKNARRSDVRRIVATAVAPRTQMLS